MIDLLKKKYGNNLGIKGDRSLNLDEEGIYNLISNHWKKVNYKQSKIWVASLLGVGTEMEKSASDEDIALCIASSTGTVYNFSKKVHRQMLQLMDSENGLGLQGKGVVEPFDWVSVTVGDKLLGDVFPFLISKDTMEWDANDVKLYSGLLRLFKDDFYAFIIPDTMWKEAPYIDERFTRIVNTVPFAKLSLVGNKQSIHVVPTISVLTQVNLLQLSQYHLGSYLADYMDIYNSLDEKEKKKYLSVDSPKPSSVLKKIKAAKVGLVKKGTEKSTEESADIKADYIRKNRVNLINKLTKVNKSIETQEREANNNIDLDFLYLDVHQFGLATVSDKKVEETVQFSIKPYIVSKVYKCPELTWMYDFNQKLQCESILQTSDNYRLFLNILYEIERDKLTQTVSAGLYGTTNVQAVLSSYTMRDVRGKFIRGDFTGYLWDNIVSSIITPKESSLSWLIDNAGSIATEVALGFVNNKVNCEVLSDEGITGAFVGLDEWNMSGATVVGESGQISVINKDTSLFKKLSLTSKSEGKIKYELVLNTGLLDCEPDEMVISYTGDNRVSVAISALFETAKDKILLLSKDV